MAYSRYPMVLHQTPSALHYLLAGLGQGLESGTQQGIMEAQRRKQFLQQILENVATGQMEPQMFATPEMQSLLQSAGVSGEAPIQSLIEQGRQENAIPARQIEFPPPGGGQPPTAPSGVEMPGYGIQMPEAPPTDMPIKGYLEGHRQRVRKQALENFRTVELPKLRAETILREQIKKGFEDTPQDIVNFLTETSRLAREAGMTPEDLSKGGLNIETSVERSKRLLERNDKLAAWKATYDAKLSEGIEYRANSAKYLFSLGKLGEEEGITPEQEANLASFGFGKVALSSVKKLDPEKVRPALVKEFNRVIQAKNKELTDSGKRALLDPAQIEQIDELDNSIFDVEENPKQTSKADIGGNILTGKDKKKPTQQEIEDLAQQLMSVPAFNQFNQKPLTIQEARRIAKKELSK